MRAPILRSPSLPMTAVQLRDDVGLESLPPPTWDALSGGEPLVSHAFLSALHETGCASAATGWQPRYVTAWQGAALVGALPLYAKTHSYGEYVFDWGWADAYRRHGRRYYPKLVVAIPFTPVTGRRMLAAESLTRRALLEHATALLAAERYSSLHVLFAEPEEAAEGRGAGMIAREGIQFHWTNPGYHDFGDYLAALNHEKRKKVKQERRKLAAEGVTFVRKTGREITFADWSFFYRCYERTYRAHHSTPYLTLEFFQRIGEALVDHMLLVMGMRDGRPLCAALDVFTRDRLWGRYWGTQHFVSGLHFEACYYQAIEFCIERGIRFFEGGAQGVHKLARGLLPIPTYSLHAIADPDFAEAIAAYCARERADIAHSLDELNESSPFKE